MNAPDDRHGGLCNIVPGPRGLTGTAKRLFLDLCGPDFLIQGVVHRQQAEARRLQMCVFFGMLHVGERIIGLRLKHSYHFVRDPGRLDRRQFSALLSGSLTNTTPIFWNRPLD